MGSPLKSVPPSAWTESGQTPALQEVSSSPLRDDTVQTCLGLSRLDLGPGRMQPRNGTSWVVTVDDAAEGAALLNSSPTEAVPDSVDSRLGCLGSAAPTDEVEAVDRLALTGHDTALVPLQVGQAGRLCSCDDGGWVVVEEVKIDRDVP